MTAWKGLYRMRSSQSPGSSSNPPRDLPRGESGLELQLVDATGKCVLEGRLEVDDHLGAIGCLVHDDRHVGRMMSRPLPSEGRVELSDLVESRVVDGPIRKELEPLPTGR
jgi:hypothetical protein